MTATQGPTCPVCHGPVDGYNGRVYDSNRCRQRAKRRRALGLPLDTPPARGKNDLIRQAPDDSRGWEAV